VGILSSNFGERNPIGSMNLDDLKITEIQLTKKIDGIHAEARRIDEETQRNYELARKATSKSEELSYARRIKTLLQKKEMKLASQGQIEKELQAVSNIIIFKEREKDLPSDVLAKLKTIEPEKLERFLISQNLTSKDNDAQLTSIISLTSSMMETGVEEDEDLSDILDTIRAGKEQSSAPLEDTIRNKRKETE
jgi:hypothetical protein